MRGPSTPAAWCAARTAARAPGSGGDLANRLAARLGETWRVDTNDVYRLLEQLESGAGGLPRRAQRNNNGGAPDLVYHPTEETSEALTLWMETLLPREPVRLGLQAKLSVAREEDADRLLAALRDYERECLVLAQLVSPPTGAGARGPRYHGLHAEAVYAQLEVEIDWASRTRQRINEFLERSQ